MRWNYLNSKKKSVLVLGSTLFFLVLAFLSPIKRTLQARTTYQNLQVKIRDAKKAPQAIAQLEASIQKWSNEMITDIDPEVLQIKLFEEMGLAAEKQNVQIRSLKSIGIKNENDFRLQTFEVIMVGSYKKLLQVLYLLEKELKYGKVASIRFFKEKVKGKKYEELHAKLFIQSATKQKAK